VTSCLLAYEGEAAAAWAGLPFFKAKVEADDILSHVAIKRLSPTLTAVVLHSTHEFSQNAAAVYGATSTAARVGGAKADAGAEADVLARLMGAAEKRLGHLLQPAHIQNATWGPHLHRWGAAFPEEPLLPADKTVVPSAKVAFAGDYIENARSGSVEGASLSGLHTAEALAALLCPQLHSEL
jgi:hypothetical protein